MTLPDFMKTFLHTDATPEQRTCDHYLSFRMKDGKHFCMSCRYVSEHALRTGEDA